jgi:hypothetical protein
VSIDQSKAENMQWRAIGKLKIVIGIFMSPLQEGQEIKSCNRRRHIRPLIDVQILNNLNEQYKGVLVCKHHAFKKH